MKKNKLIELLQSIDGNPDIYLWNGFVDDWQDIQGLNPVELTKYTLDSQLKMFCHQRKQKENDLDYQLTEAEIENVKYWHRKLQWEHNPYITQDSLDAGWHKTKKVFVLDAKKRGVNTFDRHGDISY